MVNGSLYHQWAREYSRKTQERGSEDMCGISRGIEAEEHVKIPEELSLNFHGFWFLALPLEFPQVVSYNFAEFPSVKLFLQNVHKGKVTWQIQI